LKNQLITHHACRICGSKELILLVDYGFLPLAGAFLLPENSNQNESYPLRLARCNVCTLLQVLDTLPSDIIFRKYSYASSTTHTLINHFREMAQDLIDNWQAKDQLVVEFGCNDGILLLPLQQAGARVIGVDPSDVAREASKQHGFSLYNDYFDSNIAAKILDANGPAHIVTANNTFAHNDNIHALMQGVTTVLATDGFFIFEVHYQGDLISLVQFDTVYHEHVCYYSLRSLEILMQLHDMTIIDVKPIAMHAGSVRVIAARKQSGFTAKKIVGEMLEKETTWDPERFARQVLVRADTLHRLVKNLCKSGKRVVAYGAAGRATILLNYCGFSTNDVEYVVDMSPLRSGKLIPGNLIPIVAPEIFHNDYPDYAIMTAWNYEAEIVEKEQNFLMSGGRFIVPLPHVRIIGAV
jgi:SAM-dependent methyltransferase